MGTASFWCMRIVEKLLSINVDASNIILISQLHMISCHAWFEWLFGLVLHFLKNKGT